MSKADFSIPNSPDGKTQIEENELNAQEFKALSTGGDAAPRETVSGVERAKNPKPVVITMPDSETGGATVHARKPQMKIEDKWRGVFRFRDQITLMFCLTAAFLSLGGYMYYNAQVNKQVIDVKRMPVRTAELQIDVNSAPWTELTLLPGIGEEKARRIVHLRQQRGNFSDINDLMRVEGIGPKTLDAIRPYLVPIPDSESTAQK